jgi:hypothetical protein
VCVLVALPFVALFFQGPLLRTFVLPRVEVALGELLGLTVTVEAASLDLRGHVLVSGFAAEGPTPRSGFTAVAFDEARVAFSPLGLLEGSDEWLETIEIDAPRIALDFNHDPFLPEMDETPPAEEAEPSAPTAFSLRLPVVKITGGEVSLLQGDENLCVRGLDISLDAGRGRVLVADAHGNWSLPRPDGLEFPLALDLLLADGPQFWKTIDVESVSSGADQLLKDCLVEISDAGIVGLSGDLPSCGVTLLRSEFSPTGISVDCRADRADLHAIAAFFTDAPCPQALGTGDVHFALPLDNLAAWEFEARLEVDGFDWTQNPGHGQLSAPRIELAVRRRAIDRFLRVEAQVFDLKWNDLPPVDATARLRREGIVSGRDSEDWIFLEDLVLEAGALRVQLGGALREKDLYLDDAFLVAAQLPVPALGSFWPDVAAMDGTIDLEAFFHGNLENPASYEATAFLAVHSLESSGLELPMDLSLTAGFGGCEARIDDGDWTMGDNELYFALSSGTELPVNVDFRRLEGFVGEFPFEATELPSFELDEAGVRLHPTVFQLLGGTLTLDADSDFAGGASVTMDGQKLALKRLGGLLLPENSPRGIVSFDLDFNSTVLSDEFLPDLSLQLSLMEGAFRLGEENITGIEAQLDLVVQEAQVEVRKLSVSRGEEHVNVAATVPVVWQPYPDLDRGAPVSASVEATVADIASVPFLATGFRELAGHVDLKAEIAGTVPPPEDDLWNELEVKGEATLKDGSLKLAGDFPPLSDVQAKIGLEDEEVTLTRFKARMRDSDLTITGQLGMKPPWKRGGGEILNVDVNLEAKQALLIRKPKLRVRGDVDLHWSGAWAASTVGGTVTVTRAYYREDVALTSKKGPSVPWDLFSVKDEPFNKIRLDVAVKSDRGIVVDNNVVSTEASANLQLGGTAFKPVLTGTVSTDGGTVRLGNMSHKLETSIVTFLLADPQNPRLEIRFGSTVRSVDVIVSITGTMNNPEVLMDSSPQLDRHRLLVLATTGYTVEELDDSPGRSAASIGATYAAYELMRYFASGDPTETSLLDRVSFETESARSPKYEDPIRVEYRVFDNVLTAADSVFLQGERDTYGDYNFNAGMRFELK